MKKILIVASVASMIDQFNMENIKVLKSQGYEVHVAANFEKGNTSSKKRIIEFKKQLEDMKVLYFQVDFSRKITNLLDNFKAYNKIKKLLIENNYEFIHCHSPIGGVCSRIAAYFCETKVIYTAHGFHFFKGAPLINWMVYYPIEKLLSNITDILVTINEEDYKFSLKHMNAKKVYYIPGVGIDIEKFMNLKINKVKKRNELNIPDDAILLLSVGELNKNKNHETIIKAISKISNENLHYCIAGKGKLKDSLKQLSKKYGIEEKVHFIGFRSDVDEIYKASDIFCFPSYREGLSVALMESMASGLPVVASNIRGNSDLIKYGGYLCNPQSAVEFERRIVSLIEDEKLRSKMREYNLSYIKKFGKENIRSYIIDLYNCIIKI